MSKLTKFDGGGSYGPIGRDGLFAFINELNDKRANAGVRQRYKPIIDKDTGLLTMADTDMADSKTSRSPQYGSHMQIAAE